MRASGSSRPGSSGVVSTSPASRDNSSGPRERARRLAGRHGSRRIIGIDHPVLRHARAFVEPPLDRLVALARALATRSRRPAPERPGTCCGVSDLRPRARSRDTAGPVRRRRTSRTRRRRARRRPGRSDVSSSQLQISQCRLPSRLAGASCSVTASRSAPRRSARAASRRRGSSTKSS